MIDDLESCGKPVTTKMVSALIKAHCNIGDIAGALKAYYDTCHFAAPRKAVLGLVLEKCIITDDKINIGPGTYSMCVCIITVNIFLLY